MICEAIMQQHTERLLKVNNLYGVKENNLNKVTDTDNY